MPEAPLGGVAAGLLALRVWGTYLVVRVLERRYALPDLATRLSRPPTVARPRSRHSPSRLSRAVDACLWPVGRPPRCLYTSLVLYRLLRAQGDRPELLVGLVEDPSDHVAHAWVEIGGVDVGPAPGRGAHVAMARFGP